MLLELELTGISAVLEHLNTRTEKSGPDDVPAASLKISCSQSADVLAFFSPTLKSFLFKSGAEKDLLGDVMAVRDPHIAYPLSLDHEMTGTKIEIEYGGKPMRISDCTVNKFQIEPKDGGSVFLSFMIHCKPDADMHIPKLYVLQKKAITLTLEPAEVQQEQAAA